MGNIVGEGFNKKIIEQIDQRQKIYGSLNRNEEQLSYLNARTGWCRLVSGTSIDSEVLNIRNLQGANASIAAQYILHNGVEEYNSDSNTLYQRAGVAETNNIHSGAAYGLGGTEYGLRPMPGIISAEIQTETRGSIKRATVRIQANNRAQFDIIDLLYMRLGYSMLLEWGSTSYFDNNGEYVEHNPYHLYREFLNGQYTDINNNKQNLNYNNILSVIEDFRLKSHGNYDALFCKVVNFSWSFTKDGKYDITLNLISLGDVIESLKSNVLYSGKDTLPAPPPSTILVYNTTTQTSSEIVNEEANRPLVVFRYSSEIGKYFYQIYNELEPIGGRFTGIATPTNFDDDGFVPYFKQEFLNAIPVYYIRLGYFLKWLEKNIIYNIDNDSNKKILKIDTDVKSNIIHILPNQVSSDVQVCVFKQSYNRINAVGGIDGTTYFASPDGADFVHNYGTDNIYGYLMNAYFSLDYILNEIENKKDKNGKTSTYDLLTALCEAWNVSTGNYNKLEVTVDSETNTARFIDSVLLPDRDDIINQLNPDASVETAIFDTYKYVYTTVGDNTTSKAGFIRDLSFTTTVSPELATMITVGSTNHGYVVGEDATALSRMNLGITDRYKETINDPTPPGQNNPNTDPTLEEKYSKALYAYDQYMREVGYTTYTSGATPSKPSLYKKDVIVDFQQLQNQLLEYYQAKQVIDKQNAAAAARVNDPNAPGLEAASPNAGFLPFNLSLTMDGLSGMKVYQKFTIEADFLPTNYPRALEFLIKGVKHRIESNQWITNIESMCVAKDPFGAKSAAQQTVSTTPIGGIAPASARPTNIATPASNTPLLTKAVTNQSQYVFNTRGEDTSHCANYSYNIAYKIKEHIQNNSQQAIAFSGRGPANFPAGGNADLNSHRQAINRLGLYDEQYLGTYTIPQLKQWVSSRTFNYGDMLNYYAPGYSGRTNMHTQIYTGNIFSRGITTSGTAGNSGWSSSTRTNYGSAVINYPNRLSFKVYYYQVKPIYQI